MALTAAQRKLAQRLVRIGNRVGATPMEIKAALETGYVESGFRNLNYGDRDSQGWRQERASLYPNPTNVSASARRFYKEAAALRGQYNSAGQLAAAVQRPAAQFRDRYGKASGVAESLLGGSQHPSTSNVTNPRAGDPFDAGQSQVDLSLLMQSLEKPQRPVSSAPPAPAFSARNALPIAGQAPETSGSSQRAAGSGLEATLAAVRTAGQSLPTQPSPKGSRSGRGSGAGPKGNVKISPNANRPGVELNPRVVGFVRQIAGRLGRPLTIGTGTNHSRTTVNGNVSDHWDGNGADVPLTGRALVRAGQDALITAGMSRARARKQTGGLFNVGGWQIIFNTHEGGDHTTHLHVGRRH